MIVNVELVLCEESHGSLYWRVDEHESCPACASIAELQNELDDEESDLNQARFQAQRASEIARRERADAERAALNERWERDRGGRRR